MHVALRIAVKSVETRGMLFVSDENNTAQLLTQYSGKYSMKYTFISIKQGQAPSVKTAEQPFNSLCD